MEAAAIAWRPLGRLLVEQGLLTDKELELALAKQRVTGKRLGETIVECGFVSRPDLSNALAAQYGIELTTETGFGTGLRAQIQQRHESDRGLVVPIGVAKPVEPAVEIDATPDDEAPPPAETLLLALLEEQWAKLAAAEEQLAERERELSALTANRDRRRAQVVRFARRVRTRDNELLKLGEAVEALHDQAERLAADVRGCDAEIDRLRNENARGREQAETFAARIREFQRDRDEDPVVTPLSHLVFLQLASGYQLAERNGPPPPRHSPLELPGAGDDRLIVAGSRPSPFPGDARPCVVVQRA